MSAELLPNHAPQPPAESEDPTLGKRKASQITADHEATPSVTRKRKKRRKVGPEQSISAVDNSAITVPPVEPPVEQEAAPENVTHNAASASAVADPDQSSISTARKKRKRKNAGAAQANSTPAEPAERAVELAVGSFDVPKPPPAEPSRAKKRKTVVLEPLTVIPSPVDTQVRIDFLHCNIINSQNLLVAGTFF